MTISRNRTWDIVHTKTGVCLGTITGKRRLRACMQHVLAIINDGATWQECATCVTAWRIANPRKAAVPA